MFSGIVETLGKIILIEEKHGYKQFTISPMLAFLDLKIGESIAVNGVCLTVTHFTPTDFKVDVVKETLRCTNLNNYDIGQLVNLERALKVDARISGHFVQGHVDDVGEIIELRADGDADVNTPHHQAASIAKISINPTLAKYLPRKGFVALDGMSITIIDVTPNWFTVTFIPHTKAVTITQNYTLGSLINIEVDILGKYVEKLVGVHTHAKSH